jgi:hypothetical protein
VTAVATVRDVGDPATTLMDEGEEREKRFWSRVHEDEALDQRDCMGNVPVASVTFPAPPGLPGAIQEHKSPIS